jgi:uncharacterized phage infection (PIP) family protein YhgE
MPLAEDMKNIVESIISSYEARVQSIGAIFDTTHQLLEGFQDSFLDTKQEQEKINTELRENLAKNESLRKKDFDNMMQDILSSQDQREKQVRSLLKDYLNEQREMANALGESLGNVKDALSKGEVQRIKEFQTAITEILAEQEQRKQEVSSKLKEFQKNQQEMAKRLKELLGKGEELRIKDIKSMLAEFKIQHKEWIVRQKEREKEVQNILGAFKGQRLEAAENWQAMQKKMAQRKADSQTAVGVSA